MNNYRSLNKKVYFFRLLSQYIDNNFTDKDKEILDLFYSINKCNKCGVAFNKNIYPFNQNFNSDIIVLLDPFFLYDNFNSKDEPGINELFSKIMKALNFGFNKIYLTYSVKCVLEKEFFKNKKAYKDIFLKEIEIIKPENILIFGRYAHELFFNKLDDVKYDNIEDTYQAYGCLLFFASNPVEIFYDASLKKPVWNFLKFFKKTIQI